VAKVRSTGKLESHPCVITVEEMAAARHFIKTQVSLHTMDQISIKTPSPRSRLHWCLIEFID
jgi:hypothetical protein